MLKLHGFVMRTGSGHVAVNTPDAPSLLSAVAARLAEGRGFAVATLNLDHLVKLRASEAFRRAYAAQDFVTADGNPVVWLSRLAGRPVALAAGADLVVPLAETAARAGASLALVGATEETLASAGADLRRRVPGLEIALEFAPGRGFDPDGAEADRIIAAIRASGARLVLLALGAPRQEIFAARAARALPGVGFASIGASLDFLAGSQSRAPAWVRRAALEWLWRLLSEPKRLAARYAQCAFLLPQLAVRVLADRLGLSGRRPSGAEG